MLDACKTEMKNVKEKADNLRGTVSLFLFADEVISFTDVTGSIEDLKCGISNGFCCFPIFPFVEKTKYPQWPGSSS
jgi:hypothetical protein